MAQPRSYTIRVARAADAEPIALLLGELGYPTDAPEAARRIRELSDRADARALVAVRDGEVVGVAAYHLVTLLERPRPQCRLTTLVVRSDHRRRGLARSLVAEVEEAAREAGCFRLELTTQPTRDDALAFYATAGFVDRPHRLVKHLKR